VSFRVGIDVRRATWAPQLGISRYSRCLVRAMLALGLGDVEVCTLDLGNSPQHGNVKSISVGRGHHFPQRFMQEQIGMARFTRQIDLLHLPWYEGPARPACPLVVNVHDLDTLDNRDDYRLRFRAYYNTLLRIYVRIAHQIIVPSTATLEALQARWPRGRYVLIPYGVDPIFERQPEEISDDSATYILYSGGFGARKRLGDLLAAFDRVAEVVPDVRLRIVGAAPEELVTAISRTAARDRIELTGYVEDRELVRIYQQAKVVAYPSTLEGFGFPVLEAFAAGTPVVATRAGSIPEIAGGACLLVRPTSPDELAEALLAVIEDEGLAARLAAAGRERAGHYRWSDTARQTIAAYRAAVGR
jgi:glycosyltransferase involved in cell wall biosynthesis